MNLSLETSTCGKAAMKLPKKVLNRPLWPAIPYFFPLSKIKSPGFL
jgi:hypothetical protein